MSDQDDQKQPSAVPAPAEAIDRQASAETLTVLAGAVAPGSRDEARSPRRRTPGRLGGPETKMAVLASALIVGALTLIAGVVRAVVVKRGSRR